MKPVTKTVIFPADLDEVSHGTLVLSHGLPDTRGSCSAFSANSPPKCVRVRKLHQITL